MSRPAASPPTSSTVDTLLSEARTRLRRLDRIQAQAAMATESSRAAATLRELGLDGATGLIGGSQAWRQSGLPIQSLREETVMRAIECPCGHELEGADDDELFRLAREHVDREHPEMKRSDEQLRERIAADAHDVPVAAGAVSAR